ncbi:SurA N-terminal domain-containing protein [Evansella caseinilytica]|uniref:SurA N-terminal domain-containing protein n=1 Tax=Evansella caseinilytica TaxID=1503961 RepID=A0A1H3L9I3_9BACI|nr:SurA N-terminal domain-containing protein [Evansella caseinilytica]SDY61051.1 SurA N-terminal domain-containing protein [Evansella caseinilytica]
MRRFKRNFWHVLSGLLLMTVAACGNGQDEQTEENNTSIKDINVENVAVVNGENISTASYLVQLDRIVQFYASQGLNLEEEENQQLLQDVEKNLLDSLITRELVLQEADRVNISPTEEEVDVELENFKSQFPEEEDYTEALDMNNYTEEQLREELKEELIYRKLLQLDHLDDEITVTEEELRERYDELSLQYENLGEFEDVQEQLKEEAIQQKFLDDLKEAAEIEVLYTV